MEGICLGHDPWTWAWHRLVHVYAGPLSSAGSWLHSHTHKLPHPPPAFLPKRGEDKKSPRLSISSSASFSDHF